MCTDADAGGVTASGEYGVKDTGSAYAPSVMMFGEALQRALATRQGHNLDEADRMYPRMIRVEPSA